MAINESSVLVVRSVTNAMRGQKLLESEGIHAYVQRNQTPTGQQGCGYALKISGDAVRAVKILSAAGIKVSEIQGV